MMVNRGSLLNQTWWFFSDWLTRQGRTQMDRRWPSTHLTISWSPGAISERASRFAPCTARTAVKSQSLKPSARTSWLMRNACLRTSGPLRCQPSPRSIPEGHDRDELWWCWFYGHCLSIACNWNCLSKSRNVTVQLHPGAFTHCMACCLSNWAKNRLEKIVLVKDIGVCINPQVQVKDVQVRRWLRGGGYVDCVGLLGEGSKTAAFICFTLKLWKSE